MVPTTSRCACCCPGSEFLLLIAALLLWEGEPHSHGHRSVPGAVGSLALPASLVSLVCAPPDRDVAGAGCEVSDCEALTSGQGPEDTVPACPATFGTPHVGM